MRTINKKTIVNGKFVVSTVSLPFSDTYETMVFKCNSRGTITDFLELNGCVDATPEDAEETHRTMVYSYEKNIDPSLMVDIIAELNAFVERRT